MSLVTDYVLYVYGDEPGMKRLNELLLEKHDQQFKRFDPEATGGGKYMSHDVWAMGANYVDPKSMLDLLPMAQWEHHEEVVLIIQHQDAQTPSIYVANGSAWIALF